MASEVDDRPGNETPEPAPHDASRRRTLEVLVAVGSVAYAGAIAVPAARFLDAEGSATGKRWIRVARLDALVDGKPARVAVRGEERDAFTVTADVTLGSVWLSREGERVRALSSECPHLGCSIDLAGGGESFGCPCHTSRFALDGKAESGPSPRGMDPLPTRVVDGWVEVEFRRFRQGSAQRIEVGA
jgi:menaquinol-cytochrome c reductase iron-sulfur subunit